MIYLMLGNGFEEMEAISVIDLMRRAEIQVKTVSIMGDKQVYGSRGIAIEADTVFDKAEFDSCAMIILPGGMPGTTNLLNYKPLANELKIFNEKNKPIAAICAAPMVLGELGILAGHNATIYEGMEDKLIGANYLDEKVVVSGNIITSKGPGTAIDFALGLIEYMKGKETSDKVREAILYK